MNSKIIKRSEDTAVFEILLCKFMPPRPPGKGTETTRLVIGRTKVGFCFGGHLLHNLNDIYTF